MTPFIRDGREQNREFGVPSRNESLTVEERKQGRLVRKNGFSVLKKRNSANYTLASEISSQGKLQNIKQWLLSPQKRK